MIKTFLTLIIAFFTATVFATEIEATVVFENLTNRELTSGQLIIINTNTKIDVTSAKTFKIKLAAEGKYSFTFVAEDFSVYTTYPEYIDANKNTITIKLLNKSEGVTDFNMEALPSTLTEKSTSLEIEDLIIEGSVNFIINGLDQTIPASYKAFKGKYGIGATKENCKVAAAVGDKAKANNEIIAKFLNDKYGVNWLKELDAKPFGL